ncbi:hypothetical protein BDF20DRAFT_891090 [Mycotypha africana]|uniref:uncharacterized protein n=1 Tax=Mycotypha africana TaxID=64632 RepID=UPI002300B14B|nr:uncharacterized protein BDF20DRAFT_891090 [Mycotypha africana]KAI8970404.1 hypothetical protein BDF20DRAFT_891090 [Mycotypha africana]
MFLPKRRISRTNRLPFLLLQCSAGKITHHNGKGAISANTISILALRSPLYCVQYCHQYLHIAKSFHANRSSLLKVRRSLKGKLC